MTTINELPDSGIFKLLTLPLPVDKVLDDIAE